MPRDYELVGGPLDGHIFHGWPRSLPEYFWVMIDERTPIFSTASEPGPCYRWPGEGEKCFFVGYLDSIQAHAKSSQS